MKTLVFITAVILVIGCSTAIEPTTPTAPTVPPTDSVGSGSDSGACGGDCVYNAYCNYDGYCQCDYGFTGNGYSYCYDIDECSYDYDYCSEYAYCINTIGSFLCVCREGYTGNGYYCEAIGSGSGSGSGACGGDCVYNAYCNYDGYCQCDYGFTGNGYSYCYDIDECEYYDYEEICGNADCYNTYGSFECGCFDDDYYYNGAASECLPLGEVYRHPSIELPGCDPDRNSEYRNELRYKVQDFLYYYYSSHFDYKK